MGMYGVGKQDHICLGEWIDPQGCAGETGVTIRAQRKKFAAVRGKWRIDVPTESAQTGAHRRLLWRRHLFNRQARKNMLGADRSTASLAPGGS